MKSTARGAWLAPAKIARLSGHCQLARFTGRDGRQNDGCRALNAIQRTRQSFPVAAIQMDVVA
jgi:hypothetical protein